MESRGSGEIERWMDRRELFSRTSKGRKEEEKVVPKVDHISCHIMCTREDP